MKSQKVAVFLDGMIFRGHINSVGITYDPRKRQRTPAERGLDFEHAKTVFSGVTLTLLDDREDYGEPRFQTYGLLGRRLVMVVWTPRGLQHTWLKCGRQNPVMSFRQQGCWF